MRLCVVTIVQPTICIEEGCLILIYRLTTHRKFTDVETEFGIDYTQLCRIFNTMIELTDNYLQFFFP